jgi:hypothetical protein
MTTIAIICSIALLALVISYIYEITHTPNKDKL